MRTQTVHVDTLTSEATDTRPVVNNSQTAQHDKLITDSIKAQIEKSTVLSPLHVTVKTKNGVVTYTGNVASDSLASELIELAQSTNGVQDVDTQNLKIEKSTQPLNDMIITAKVKGLFIRDDVFGTKDIASINLSVETNKGIVYLTGVIDNKEQIKNAIKLVKQIKGVKKVEYRVKQVTIHGNDATSTKIRK